MHPVILNQLVAIRRRRRRRSRLPAIIVARAKSHGRC